MDYRQKGPRHIVLLETAVSLRTVNCTCGLTTTQLGHKHGRKTLKVFFIEQTHMLYLVKVTYPLPPFLWYPCGKPGHCFKGVVPLQGRTHTVLLTLLINHYILTET